MSWNYYKLYYDLLAHSLNPVQILTVSDLSFHFLSFGYLFNWSSRQERLLKSESKKKKSRCDSRGDTCWSRYRRKQTKKGHWKLVICIHKYWIEKMSNYIRKAEISFRKIPIENDWNFSKFLPLWGSVSHIVQFCILTSWMTFTSLYPSSPSKMGLIAPAA